MDQNDTHRRGKLDNVVFLDFRKAPMKGASTSFKVYAHLYVDLCSDGETRFGVMGANEDNAINLLEPIFILGRQLVQLSTA